MHLSFTSIKIGQLSTSPFQQLITAYGQFKEYISIIQSDGFIYIDKLNTGIKPQKKALYEHLKKSLPTLKCIKGDTMSNLKLMMEELQT